MRFRSNLVIVIVRYQLGVIGSVWIELIVAKIEN